MERSSSILASANLESSRHTRASSNLALQGDSRPYPFTQFKSCTSIGCLNLYSQCRAEPC